MKKKILATSIIVGSALLTSCINPSDDNSSVLQNALIKGSNGQNGADLVTINQSSIPGFENSSGTNPNPTQVTVTFSGGAAAARTAGCKLGAADDSEILTGLTATTSSLNIGGSLGDSLLGILYCNNTGVPNGTYTADVTISFTAGSKSYTANTTLTAILS